MSTRFYIAIIIIIASILVIFQRNVLVTVFITAMRLNGRCSQGPTMYLGLLTSVKLTAAKGLKLEPCAGVIVSAAARRSILVGGGRAARRGR